MAVNGFGIEVQPTFQSNVSAGQVKVDDTQLYGYYYLSHVTGQDNVYKAYNQLLEVSRFIPDSYKRWFDWYISSYQNEEVFPTWEKFLSESGFKADLTYDYAQAQAGFSRQLVQWESDYLIGEMPRMNLLQRRETSERLRSLLSETTEEMPDLHSLTTFSTDEFVIKDDRKSPFKFPLQKLNTQLIVNAGQMITVMAPPSMGKTTFALNTVFLNSVLDNKNTLYIYLENKESAYQAELRSRYSYYNGMRIENASLKRGVLPEDSAAIERIGQLEEDFRRNMKGNVYFVPFSRFNPEPMKYAHQLAAYVRKYDIKFLVFDYLQLTKNYAPSKYSRMEYIDSINDVTAQCGLGMFDTEPFVTLMLAQLRREGEDKAIKSKGASVTMTDGAEASSIERTSFVVMSLFADAEMKASQSFSLKVLKNRDEASDTEMQVSNWIPCFGFMGDEGAVQEGGASGNAFSVDAVSDMFAGLDGLGF